MLINDKVAKPSSDVKVGDVIAVTFGEKTLKIRVEIVTEHVLKGDAQNMYTVV